MVRCANMYTYVYIYILYKFVYIYLYKTIVEYIEYQNITTKLALGSCFYVACLNSVLYILQDG